MRRVPRVYSKTISIMKFLLKNFTIGHYLRHVRRQSKHVQHLHAVVFAGLITALITSVILYTDYGFWHETYKADSLVAEEASFKAETESRSFGEFLREAKARFGSIGTAGANLLEGKETYTRDDANNQ
jgi:hypothetical protein